MSILWSVAPAVVIAGLTAGTGIGQAAFLAGWVLIGPATTAVWTVARLIVRHEPFTLRALPAVFRQQWIAGLLFFLVDGGLGWLLAANVRFYFTSTLGILGRPVPWLGEGMRAGHLIGLLWVAPLLLWLLAQLYALPLLIEERSGIASALRRAAVLVVDNIWFTLELGVVVIVLSVILALTGIGAFVLLPGLLAVLTTNATHALLGKYRS